MNLPTQQTRFREIITDHFERSITASDTFFKSEADRIALACRAMARRFQHGGRLLSFGEGASVSDAQHVAVEFVHPVLVGKRALPALALTKQTGLPSESFAAQLGLLARPQDIALGFSVDGQNPNDLAAFQEAKRLNLLTVALSGGDGGGLVQAGIDFCFIVRDNNAWVVQEILYHILWELVHVFFEHESLLLEE
jgi:D-sedoheptulose 7-phosphate isomerase